MYRKQENKDNKKKGAQTKKKKQLQLYGPWWKR